MARIYRAARLLAVLAALGVLGGLVGCETTGGRSPQASDGHVGHNH